jgi:hypothetical protein
MQAAMLLEHGSAIAARDFVNVHGHLDHGAIQGAEGIEELVDLTGWNAAGAQFSKLLFSWLVHRTAPLHLID